MQDAFLEAISFAVLRLLVQACRIFETKLCHEHETVFVANVWKAVKYVRAKSHFQRLKGVDKAETKSWDADLRALSKKMQQVRKRST